MGTVIQYTVQKVCDVLDVKLPEEYREYADVVLTNITMDVNNLRPGGALLLTAENREKREAKLQRALKWNPGFIIAGKACRKLEALKAIPHILVEDVYDAMVTLSASMREALGLNVISITGSLGKTTTKEIVYSVLNEAYVSARSLGNQNTIAGAFHGLQSLEDDVQFFVQEVGVALGKKKMDIKVRACLPNAAVITNISDPHLDVFGSRENLMAEKLKMAKEMEKGSPVFLNYDDELLKNVKLDDYTIVSYAVENPEAEYHAESIQYLEDTITFEAVRGERRVPITLHSREKHNIGNALAAMAIGEWFKMPMEQIVKGIDAFRSEGIRQSLVNIGGYQIYVDCYNTAPVSLLGAVEVLERIPVEDGGKRVAVIGDIVRLGEKEKEIHKEVGRTIGQSTIDLVLCFGNENARILAEAVRKENTAALYTSDRNELNYWMRSLITRKDVTLVKGPVARLLSKSIDQVYGTSYHVRSEHHDFVKQDGYLVSCIYEKEDHNKKLAALLKYYGSEKQISVPSVFQKTDVFCVATGCYANNQNVETVIMEAPVFNISERAFSKCRSLQSIKLPETLKVIGSGAFEECTSLTEIVIPEGTIDVGENAFVNCEQLEKVVIPETVGRIGEGVWDGCKKVCVYCGENTYAHRYAVEHSIPFMLQ